jgi:hypothetical protein
VTTINLSTFAVRDEAGEMNLEATLQKFKEVLFQHQVERETELSTIGAAVHTVFDKNKGATINTPALLTMTLLELNVQRENHKVLVERIQNFMRKNTVPEGTTFRTSKGKGGGVSRVCDCVDKPKTAKTAKKTNK